MANTNASTTRTAGHATPAADRRTRLRLRELCDEVLASYRLASDRDLFTADDRTAARQLIPLLGR
ncbi:MAG TPA: hypothetical protein VFT96_13155 [Gemmatimonadaceae bacterium]|nr:hypothetical protein [Gemmatimonadaceae bacterium]